jgi:hypothetical protein
MHFSETQYPPKTAKRLLLWVAVVSISFMSLVIFVTQLDNAVADASAYWVILGMTVLSVLLAMLFLNTRLYVDVNQNHVLARMSPFHIKGRLIPWQNVQEITLRRCQAFGEFGGWGVRYAFTKKMGYIWDGKHCIELQLRSGNRVVITIVNIEGLAEFLDAANKPFIDKRRT